MQSLGQLCELRSGHGSDIQTGANTGSEEQQPWVFENKLSLGDAERTGQQYPIQRTCPYVEGSNDDSTSSKSIRAQDGNSASAVQSRRYGITPSAPSEVAVYDVVNVQPGNCFTVRGKSGKVFIVHNSGAVYSGDGNYLVVDSARYDLIADIVEERDHSVTFFNWKHQRDLLAAKFDARGITYAIIDGDTPDSERTQIVADYQAGRYRTLLLHPRTGAHGLTLTRGTSTILCSPIYEADLMKQIIHRIYRGTQNQVTNTLLVCAANTVEEYVYGRLDQKSEDMADFLEMVRASKDYR